MERDSGGGRGPLVIQLFVNPRPQRWVRHKIAALRRAFEAGGATVLVAQSVSGDLKIDPRADHVCSAGGDGTLRHVVAAVRACGRPVSVSAYPAGTINLLARECGYSHDPEVFARRVLAGTGTTPHYAALVDGTPMLVCASVGPDCAAIGALSSALKRAVGRAAYAVAFTKLWVRWPCPQLTLRHDGGSLACEAVYVAKGRYFAGPWSFAPQASVRDPVLHVVAFERMTRRHFLRFAAALAFGRDITAIDGVRHFTCVALAIEGDAPVQADGDIVGRLPVTIAVDPEPIAFA